MIDHVWTVVCAMSVVDRETNNISLFNIVEQLTLLTQPEQEITPQLPLDIVTLWARADDAVPARGFSRLTFRSPAGDPIHQEEGRVDLSDHERLRMRRRLLLRLNLRESGRYCFCVEVRLENETEWRTVATVPLKVVVEPASDQTVAPE